MEDEELEYTLFNKRECSVYQIPPASSSSGHKANDWKQCIWQGRIRIVGKGKDLFIKLVDASSGSLFAQCSIPGGEHAKYVERVIDSSRYFVLKIQNGQRHAFIGLGFEDRNDAFDFNCTLNEFKTTWIDREKLINEPPPEHTPSKDLSLKEGQKITINLKGLGGESAAKKKEQKSEVGGPINILAPPPSSGVSRRAAAAANAPATTTPAVAAPAAAPLQAQAPPPAAAAAAARPQDDFFGDFADFQSADFQSAPAAAAPTAPLAAPAAGAAATTPAPAPAPPAPVAAPAAAAPAKDGGYVSPLQPSSAGKGGGYSAAPVSGAPPFDPFAGVGGFQSAAPAPAQHSMPSMPAAKPVTATRPSDPFDEFDIFK